MHAIEFFANAEDGVIKVPKEYLTQLSDKFRVIILQDQSGTETPTPRKKRTFEAVRINTKDLKFDRDEANER